MDRKCKHGPLWSLCFEEAKAKGRFSEECIVNIFEDMFLYLHLESKRFSVFVNFRGRFDND